MLALALFLPVTFLAFLFTRDTDIVTPPQSGKESLTRVTIANIPVYVTVADDAEEKTQGLGGRASLGESEGMLFLFKSDGRPGIWMKAMLIPIDIIWADKDGRVVHIEHSISPTTYPKTFSPDTDARYVLEVNAGFSEAHGLRLGDLLNIEP